MDRDASQAQCRDCGAVLQRSSSTGLCAQCRQRRIDQAWARLDRQRRWSLISVGLGVLWLGLLTLWVRWQDLRIGVGIFVLAAVGAFLLLGGAFSWLVAWGVQAWHRDRGREV